MKSLHLLLLVTFAKVYPTIEGKLSLNGTNSKVEGFIPRSCLDYLQRGILENDFYQLYDDDDQIYVAFCDLSKEPGSAWTLVMSWESAKYRELPYFKTTAFSDDAPINENTPNWYIYRQTLARMNSIRKHSTHWRATCEWQFTSRFDYQDYLRGKFSDFDIMSFVGSGCQPIEYVNILGNIAGSGTTVKFFQNSGSYGLHIDSFSTGCEFLPLADPKVDYFGYYGDGLSTEFRCCRYDSSTTQWWFGGYLEEH